MAKEKSFIDRMLGTSKSPYAALMHDSDVFDRPDSFIETDIPIMNVALSSKIDEGLRAGVLMIAGESKRFKTLFGLYLMAAFQKKHPNSACIFFDSEFGTPRNYIDKVGLDWKRIIHIPVIRVVDLKHEVVKKIDLLKDEHNIDNKVFMLTDSIGNLASSKEVRDARDDKDVGDMSRAKELKSLFRIITADLNLLDVPFVCINHTYKSQGFIAQDVVSGGTGGMLAADNVWIVTRKQDKETSGKKQTLGFKFIININKSRYVKEKTKLPITVHYVDGIHKYSGLSDLAVEFDIVESIKIQDIKGKPKGLKYKDREILLKGEDVDSDFWEYVLEDSDLKKLIHDNYSL